MRTQKIYLYRGRLCVLKVFVILVILVYLGISVAQIAMGCNDYEKIASSSSLTHAIFFGFMLVLYIRVGCGLNEILRRGFPFFYKIKGFEIRLHVYLLRPSILVHNDQSLREAYLLAASRLR